MTREPRGERRTDINFGWLIWNMRKLMGDDKVKLEDCIMTYDRSEKSLEKANQNRELAHSLRLFVKASKDKSRKKK